MSIKENKENAHHMIEHTLDHNSPAQVEEKGIIPLERDVSMFFELTYAQFLTIPRLYLEHMSKKWQVAFVKLLDQLDEAFSWKPKNGQYWVNLRGDDGKFKPLNSNVCDYRHGKVSRRKHGE